MLVSCLAAVVLQASPPNVIVVMADDLGYADVSFNGNGGIPTPNIDSIAQDGIKFTSGYVTAPACAPSRAGLLTGICGTRFGFENNPSTDDSQRGEYGLPAHVPTLAERLKAIGYSTGLVGKWHLGERLDSRPLTRGFDQFYGFLEGGSSYLPGDPGLRTIYEGTEPVALTEYLTDSLSSRAVNFIGENAGQPFFLFLSYSAPHYPYQATENYKARFPNLSEPRRSVAAMISAMDDGVGRVIGELKSRQLYENTLIFFLSDNGGVTADGRSINDPLSGFKGSVKEGGIRVPFAVSWPNRFKRGVVDERMVSALDIVPTAMAAAGRTLGWTVSGIGWDDPVNYVDGRSLINFCRQENPATGAIHPSLGWRYGAGKRAFRSSNSKYIYSEFEGGYHEGVYDLATDISESINLRLTKPTLREWLKVKWTEWDTHNIPPLW